MRFFRKPASAIINAVRMLWLWTSHQLIGTSLSERSLTVRNEILRLRAAAADRLSTACFSVGAAGVVAPLAAPIFHGGPTIPKTFLEVLLIFGATLIWLAMGFVLHMIGEAFLLKLGDK